MNDDLISREATLKPYKGLNDKDTISVWLIRKNIEQQPSVNPQEQKTDTLDKIRAEIENHCGGMKENHCKYCYYCNSVMGVREILEIIDKYKAKSE